MTIEEINKQVEEKPLTKEECNELVTKRKEFHNVINNVDDSYYENTNFWDTYTNTLYKYSFKYPSEMDISAWGAKGYHHETTKSEHPVVEVIVPQNFYDGGLGYVGDLVEIDVLDKQSPRVNGLTDIINLSLKDFVNEVWLKNKQTEGFSDDVKCRPDKNVSNVIVGNLDNTEAHQFSMIGHYTKFEYDSEFILEEENHHLFIENPDGIKMIIKLPVDQQLSYQILSTFKFVE